MYLYLKIYIRLVLVHVLKYIVKVHVHVLVIVFLLLKDCSAFQKYFDREEMPLELKSNK